MNFRHKIEVSLEPLVRDLKARLRSLPTFAVLDWYQFRIDAAGPDRSGVPDGFHYKWRYLWALLLSNPFSDSTLEIGSEVKRIDELVEKIFATYEVGALCEPGRMRSSAKEFLTRLGLAIRVREPETLAFAEQVREWAVARFQPFDDSYFRPTFGLSVAEIFHWLDSVLEATQSRLNLFVEDFRSIMADLKSIQAQFGSGELDEEAARTRAIELKIEERLESNSSRGDKAHLLSTNELPGPISEFSFEALIKRLGIRPGSIGPDYRFPHDESPLALKTFVVVPDGRFYFFDPGNAYGIVAKNFEAEILANNLLRQRYLKRRDRAVENWVTGRMKTVFANGVVYPNYYLEAGGQEKDLFVRYGDAIVLIECKNYRLRPFKGSGDDLLKFEEDFKNSIQHGYDQALAVKRRIRDHPEVVFLDDKGNFYFSVKRDEIKEIHIVCVTITARGPFGTDLSYELSKPESEPFPLAVNLFDFDIICKHLNRPEQLIAYLRSRERLHGRVQTGDELNFAGYFVEFGNLDFEDGTFLDDSFSGVFDRRWYRKKASMLKNQPAHLRFQEYFAAETA